jgi:hypothetical protein
MLPKMIWQNLIDTHEVPQLAPEIVEQGEMILEVYDKKITDR